MTTLLCGECLNEVEPTETVHGDYYCQSCGEYRVREDVIDEDNVGPR